METQTKPELKEPEHPTDVALDIEDSSRIDVCVQPNSFWQRLVHVYIRDSHVNIDALLEDSEDLESRVFEGERTDEIRERFLEQTKQLKPWITLPRDDGCYLLEYDLSLKKQVYDAVREL
jgi:hypothetical protein